VTRNAAPAAKVTQVCAGGVLTAAQLALLAAVQDRLIPREDALPGAGEAGAAAVVDRYLSERPSWRPHLLAALQAIDAAAQAPYAAHANDADEARAADGTRADAGRAMRHAPGAAANEVGATGFLRLSPDEQDAVLRRVEAAQPRYFAWLVRLTYAAYYTDAGVQRARGVPVEPPLPRGHQLPTFDESRLDPIRCRGKLWRDA
jgi:hypothetical protein